MKNLSLPIKFTLLVGGLLALFAVYGLFTLNSLNRMGNTMHQLAGNNLSLIRAADKVNRLLLEQQLEFGRGSQETDKAVQVESYGTLRIKASAENFDKLGGQVEQSLQQTRSIVSQMPQSATRDKIDTLLDSLHKEATVYRDNANKTYDWWQKRKLFQAKKFHKAASAATQNIEKLMREIDTTIGDHSDLQLAESRSQMERTRNLALLILVVAITLGALFAWWLSRSLTHPLAQAVRVASDLAAGNLDVKPENDARRDEIGRLQQAIATLVEQLTGVIGQVSESSQQLQSSADGLSRSTSESTRLIQRQSNETDQIAAAIREINEATQHVASQTTDASNLASEAEEAANQGQQRVRETAQAVQTLASEIEQSRDAMNHLDSQSREISNILNVIVTIAEQTNLLALNAAIEAARAGEHGRGFAVVADEVRKLAQNTQNATQEIEQMITQLQQGVKGAVSSMETSHSQSQAAVERAREGEQALATVCEVIENIRMVNTAVSTASEQQSASTATVAGNLENILSIANQSNHTTHEISAASDQLAELAARLQGQVSYFHYGHS